MASPPDCPVPIKIVGSNGITVANPSDYDFIISSCVSADAGNALRYGTDGCLYIDECDLGPCVEGLRDVTSGFELPLNANNEVNIGLAYDEGGSGIPVNATTGVYELPWVDPLVLHTYSTGYSTCYGQPVYRDAENGLLRTQLPVRYQQGTRVSANNYGGTSFTVGQFFNFHGAAITNFDGCGRPLYVKVIYTWCGVKGSFSHGDYLRMDHIATEIAPGSNLLQSFCTSEMGMYSPSATDTTTSQQFGEITETRIATLQPGESMNFGIGYQVLEVRGTPHLFNPLGSTSSNVFSSRITWSADY